MADLRNQGSERLIWRRDKATGLEAIRAQLVSYSYDIHSHDDEWLVGVTHRGTQDFFCRGKRWQSTAGWVMFIEPSERHDGRSADAGGYAYSMLSIPRSWLHGELRGDSAIGFSETIVEDESLAEAITSSCKAIIENAPRLLVESVRDAIVNRLRPYLGASPRQKQRLDMAAATRAQEYMIENYGEDVSSAELVRISGAANRFQLSRSFKAKYGTSLHASLVQIRIAKARSLLRQEASLVEVAAACGFADQSHLTRWFQRAYGIPPGVFARGCTNVQDLT